MDVLIGYASEHGSTRGIAERIAAKLKDSGARVDVRSLHQVDGAERYDAFVLGSAVHNGAWMPVAAGFVRANQGVLAGRPVWLFSVGTVGDHSSMIAPSLTRLLRAISPGSQSIEPKDVAGFREVVLPRDHHTFAGVLERDHYPRVGRVIFRLMGGRYGDHRDWAEIDAWAAGIAHALTAG